MGGYEGVCMREGVYMGGGVCTRERYDGGGTYDPGGMGRESILIGQDTTAISLREAHTIRNKAVHNS